MKINPNANIPRFLQAVQSCQGEIHFITHGGDDLNLKSALSQVVFVAVMAKRPEEMQGEIRCQNPEDFDILQGYLL